NRGKGYAVRQALKNSEADFLVYTDIDFPFETKGIVKAFRELKKGADVVAGQRIRVSKEGSGFKRVFFSVIWRFFVKFFMRLPVKDTQCGLKGLSKKGKEILLDTRLNRYLFDFEFIVRSIRSPNINIREIVVDPKPGIEPTQMKLRLFLLEAVDIFRVFKQTKFFRRILFLAFFLFALSLMSMTFSHDPDQDVMLIGTTVFSDFAAHIPLIRSFTEGANWPPEYPLYPGSVIQYHFLFFLVVGLLEKIGVRIDIALNVLGALGFSLLMSMIFILGRKLFSLKVGLLSVLFFLFNGSLGFIDFFKEHPLSTRTLSEIYRVKEFPAFGPWNGSEVSAFWSLNIYTNQRHLAFGFAFLLFFIYQVLKLKDGFDREVLLKGLGFGLLVGIFPILHQPTCLLMAVILILYFLFFPSKRAFFFTVGLTSLMLMAIQYPFFLTFLSDGRGDGVVWRPGYLISDSLSLTHFVSYWWKNLGLHSVLIPIGFYLSSNKVRIIMLPAIIMFMLASLFQFSLEMAANHKFYNFFLILAQMLSAYSLVRFWDYISKRFTNLYKVLACRAGVIVLVFFMVLSGVIDFMVIRNNRLIDVPGRDEIEVVEWIKKNTPKDAIFLNSRYIFHPASLAGRKIFLGWPYFVWSAGYDTNKRYKILEQIYTSRDFPEICSLLRENNISHISLEEKLHDRKFPIIDYDFYVNQINPDYVHPRKKFAIYSRERICKFCEKF
ncbi:MAG: hypothetical protein JRJ02_06665, partial [Deltaproteobacteria bacterium]|nr:hypothetical protein [Deltaproteobacteria bacterium]